MWGRIVYEKMFMVIIMSSKACKVGKSALRQGRGIHPFGWGTSVSLMSGSNHIWCREKPLGRNTVTVPKSNTRRLP
jgi:hypothetical protein